MEKELREQTAMETAGIPTPPDQEHIGATDGAAEAVEAMMDKLAHDLTGAEPPEDRKRKTARDRNIKGRLPY